MNKFYKKLRLLSLLVLVGTAWSARAQFPAPYCPVAWTNTVEPITLVNFAGINNTSVATTGTEGHQDFTAITGAVTPSISYPITLKGNTAGNFTCHFNVFFDWNHDNDFDDAGESYYIGSITNSNGTDAIQLTGNITVPVTALQGATRMRVVKKFNVQGTACNTAGFGQGEDYTVTVSAPPACMPPSNIALDGTATTTSATVTWVAPATAPTGYEYVYSTTSTAPADGATGTATTDTSVSLTGLTGTTTYYFWIRSNCGGTFSAWAPFNFTTPIGNDDCANAIALTVNGTLTCTATTAGSTLGATNSMAADPCNGNPDDDVWFSFVATAPQHKITIANVAAIAGTGTATDMYFQVLEGDCNSFTSILCSDPNENYVQNLTVGETYFIRVYSFGNTTRNTFTICVATPPAPPANDTCEGAVALTVNPDFSCGATTTGTTAGAMFTMAATPCNGNPDDDVWYSFVATGESHRISLTGITAVEGTSTDMYFQVLEGSCDGFTSLLCSDDNLNNYNTFTPGETYYIRVYSYGNTSRNNFTICIGTPPPPPANDDCEGAIDLTVNPDYACGTTTTATTVSATNYMDAAPCTGNPDDDVFFRFTATAESHKITISNVTAVSGTGTDMFFQVLSGVCGSFESLLCSDPNDNVVTGLDPGSEYYVRVYSVSATSRQNFTICVGTPPGPPANDDCEGAVTLTVNADLACGVTATGTTASATNYMDAAPCAGNPDDDVFFKFVATGPTHRVVLSNITAVVGTSTDMYFQVLDGTCGSFTSLHCSDPNDSFVSGLTAGETYYIRVYSYAANAAQNFTICVGTPTAPAPANDECAGAVSLTVSPTATCAGQTAGTTAGSSQSMTAAPCTGTADDDVWYSFVATNTVHTITLSGITAVAGGTSTDGNFQLLNGSCAATTSLYCSDPNSATIGGFVAGQLYYVRVYSGASTTQISFNICVTTPAITTPANDDCATAIALTPGAVFGTNPLVAGNTNATASMQAPLPGCASYSGGDVWYTVAVPASGSITVETNSNSGGTVADTGLALYSGTCTSLVLVECDDDDSTDGNFSKIALTGRTPGEILYIRTWEYGNDSTGTWKISAFDGSLGNEQFEAGSFRHYPNPVKDVLNISYISDITSVKVYNLLGQQVLAKEINAAETAVDMSSLTDGAYIVNVAAGESVTTFKVIKKQ